MTSEFTYEVLFSCIKEDKKSMQRFDPCLKAYLDPFFTFLWQNDRLFP